MSRCPSSVGEQRTSTGPVHRISIKHERCDQRLRIVVPASSTLSKPCPSIGPNLRAWWVPRKHDTSTQCWSTVGQRLLAQHWPSTGSMYRVCRVFCKRMTMTMTSFVFTQLANTIMYGGGVLYNLVFTE